MLENFASPIAPQYAIQGQLWFKNSTNEMFVNTNVLTNPATPNWVKLLIDGYVTTDVNFGGYKLTNVGTPTASTDAATKGYVDGNFLPLTGGSLSGNLVLTGASIVTLPNAPSAGTDATNKTYVDTSIATAIGGVTGIYVLKAGDTMSGNLHITAGGLTATGPITLTGAIAFGGGSTFNAGGIVLNNLVTPVIASDAATKGYVDTSISTQAATDAGLYVAKAGSTMTGALIISAGGLDVTGGVTLPTGNLTLTSGTLFVTGGVTLGATTTTDFGANVVHNIGTPAISTDAATKGYVDTAVASVIVTAGGDGVVTSGDLNTGTGVLTLHRSLSGKSTISLYATPTITPTTSLSIAAGSYTFELAIDGAAAVVHTVTATGTDTMTTMAALMQATLLGAATVTAVNNTFVVTSSSTGISSAVIATIPASSGTDLIGAIETAKTATTTNVSVPSDVVITGNIAPFVHAHQAADVTVNADPSSYPQSYMRDQLMSLISFPTVTLVDVIDTFDRALSVLKSPALREVVVQSGGTTAYTLGFDFRIEYNQLSVYVNGVKQVADLRGAGGASTSPSQSPTATVVGLNPALAYTIIMTVNGTLYTITIPAPVSPAYTYFTLAQAIDAQFVSLVIPAIALYSNNALLIFSTTVGTGSEITISGGTLWAAATGFATPFSSAVTTNYAYHEVGLPYQTSSDIVFNVAPANGAVIEFISLPK
jgi:hypothetical protein